jgi:ribosomal protein S27AE
MEPAVPGVPAPVIMERPNAKPVLINPPEVNGAHDYALIGYILVLLMTIPWFIVVLTIGAFGVLASPYLPFPIILPPTLPAWLSAIPFIGPILILLTFPGVGLPSSWFVYLGVGGGGLLIGIIFLSLIYLQTVRAIAKGRYGRARGGTLFWAVLFIIPAFAVLVSPSIFYPTILLLLPAFFFLMAYGRLGEVVAKYGPIAVLGEAIPGMGVAPTPPPPGFGAPVPGVPGPVAMGVPMVPPVTPSVPMAEHQVMGPRAPQCPTCGRDLYYSANHRRWYCQTCDAGGRP